MAGSNFNFRSATGGVTDNREPSCCPSSDGPGKVYCELTPGNGGWAGEGVYTRHDDCRHGAYPLWSFEMNGGCAGHQPGGGSFDYCYDIWGGDDNDNYCNWPNQFPDWDCCMGSCYQYGEQCEESYEVWCHCPEDCSGGWDGYSGHWEPGGMGPGGGIEPHDANIGVPQPPKYKNLGLISRRGKRSRKLGGGGIGKPRKTAQRQIIRKKKGGVIKRRRRR